MQPNQTYTQRPPTEQEPIYGKVAHGSFGKGTQLYFITIDQGWRKGILCERMYEWAADWLLTVLERRPYAPQATPLVGPGL